MKNPTRSPLFTADAFATEPFTGNPAAVFFADGSEPDELFGRIALEMNLAETAFVYPADEQGVRRLRWFTPAYEVRLCGHATLASAHILWSEGMVPPEDEVRFQTLSGILTASQSKGRIELDFPAEPCEPCDDVEHLLDSLGLSQRPIYKNRMDYLVEAKDEAELMSLSPNMERLKRVETRGVIVTCRSDRSAIDFVSRFFAPGAGVNEDPVTGSAHCALSPFWSDRLNETSLTGFQASARGGTVWTRLQGDRVILAGHAVTVLVGTIRTA